MTAVAALAALPKVAEVRMRIEHDRLLGLQIALDVALVAKADGPRCALTCATTCGPGDNLDLVVGELVAAMGLQVAAAQLELEARARARSVTESACVCGARAWSTTGEVNLGVPAESRLPTLKCQACGRTWFRAQGAWMPDTGTEPAPKLGRPPKGDDDQAAEVEP